MNFDELKSQVILLSQNGDNKSAADLLREHQSEFPEHAYMMSVWQIGALSLAGYVEEALGVLRDALDNGMWYPSELLKSDADLKALHGLPEFDDFLARCDEQRRMAQQDVIHQHRLLRSQGPSSGLLVALHGNFSNLDSQLMYWEGAADFTYDVLLSQSTQVAAPDRYIWNNRDKAIEDVLFDINEVFPKEFISSNVVFGGFSAGAGLAMWMSLTGPIQSTGFIAIAPRMIDIGQLRRAFETHVPAQMRGYILAGKNDPESMELTNDLIGLLNEHSITCSVDIRDNLGHDYPDDFKQTIKRALLYICDKGVTGV